MNAKVSAHEVCGSHRDEQKRRDIAADFEASGGGGAEGSIAADGDYGVGCCQDLRIRGGWGIEYEGRLDPGGAKI